MALTDKYDLEEIDYGTEGWNGIQSTNNEIIDENMQTRQIDELGENVSTSQAVYIKSDGKVWLAQADGSKQPSVGLMIEDGVALDTDKRYQVMGEFTDLTWTWTLIGQPVYLSAITPGALTEVEPAGNSQIMGIIKSATKILLTSIWQSSSDIAQPYIVGGGYSGSPTASLVIIRHPITEWEPTFPVSLDGSKMVAGVAATAETIFSIKKDGVEFGTATFAIAGTVATFAGAGAKLNEDDVLTMVAPGSPDATLADLGISLLATRSVGTTTSTTTTSSSSSSTTSTT